MRIFLLRIKGMAYRLLVVSIYFILTAMLLGTVTSCTKDFDFFFDTVGGPMTFDLEIEGETLRITDGDIISGNPSHYVTDEKEYFTSELENVNVFFYPEEKYIRVLVKENTSGKLLWYKIYGYLNGEERSIVIKQK